MHEGHKLYCIFGCRASPDKLEHYIICPILWSLLDEAFGGSLTPCLFSRLDFACPCERYVHLIVAAFDIYHALNICLRSVADAANRLHVYAPVLAQANVLARDHARRHRDSELEISFSSTSSSTTSESEIYRLPTHLTSKVTQHRQAQSLVSRRNLT